MVQRAYPRETNYELLVHDHGDEYSPLGHDHDLEYEPAVHTHDDDTGWVEITDFSNGATPWATGVNNAYTPRVRRINGIVYMQGLIDTNSTATSTGTVATLPVGFRPRDRLMGLSLNNAGVRRMDVFGSGSITFSTGNAYDGSHTIDFSFPADG